MGHLTLISEDVISALTLYPDELSATIAQYAPQPQWDNYVSGRFRETKAKDSSQLGGGKPNVTAGRAAGGGEASVASATGRGAAGLKVDEAEVSGIGSSPAARPSSQNVVFAPYNEDEEDTRRNGTGPPPASEEVCVCDSKASRFSYLLSFCSSPIT